MNKDNEWTTVSTRKSGHTSGINRFHAQKRTSILEQVANGSLTPQKADQMLRPTRQRPISRTPYCHTTKSGAVAVYGFSRRPMVLYENRWYQFFEWMKTGELEQYLKDNTEHLKKPSEYHAQHSGAPEVSEDTITDAKTTPDVLEDLSEVAVTETGDVDIEECAEDEGDDGDVEDNS